MSTMQTTLDEQIPLMDLSAQYAYLCRDITRAIDDVLQSQHFILGPQVASFEKEVAAYCSSAYGVGVASGTDALVLALHAAGVRAGDEVIVPAFSFIASADAVSLLHAIPVFADVEPDTLNLDAESARTRITPKTKAIIVVHLYGNPAAMDAIMALAGQHGLAVIEDGAQALGAMHGAQRVCSIGDFGCTSFFPSKNLGGYGDGGMVFVQSKEVSERLRMLRSHGSRKKYHNEEQGWNSRLDEIQAAILRVKLLHLDRWNEARRENAMIYTTLLECTAGVEFLKVRDGMTPVYHQFTIRVPQRDTVQQKLAEAGIQTAVYYPIPLHLQGMYQHLGYKRGDLPISEAASLDALSLPMYPELTQAKCERVATQLKGVLRALGV
jgi:dTDP-4-amino-4,6-dideoxygalactose transaminase